MERDPLSELALAAGHGDDRALAEFVRATQDRVRRLCVHLGSAADADDLTQETYLRMLGSLPRYRGDAPAEAWLLQIARNTCADHVRRQVRRGALGRRLGPPPAFQSPDHTVELTELLAAVDRDRAEAFVLTAVLGLPYEEAALVLGCPVGTVRSRVSRARADLTALVRDATAS